MGVTPDTAHFDAISKGTSLYGGDNIYVYPTGSGGWLTRLIMQTDGNLVLYGQNGTFVCWASNTAGNAGAYATYESSGNFAVYNELGRTLWSSHTAGKGGSTVSLNKDNGSLYVGTTFIDGPCY